MNILIVDDRPSNLKLLRAVLEAEGTTVCEAADGFEALGVLQHHRVDAIISDILMPRMDGYRLCMEVRANHQFCDTPFIAYTATYTSIRDEKLMADIGADRFLRKPASAAVLSAMLTDVVQSKRRRPPTPARARLEVDLLKEYNERLAAKLEEWHVARGTGIEITAPVGNDIPGMTASARPSPDLAEQWRKLIATSTAAVFVVQDDCIMIANAEAARITAVASPDDLVGRNLFDFVPKDQPLCDPGPAQPTRLQDKPLPLFEQKLTRADGSVVEIETCVLHFQSHDQAIMLVEARVISERRCAESRFVLQHAVTAALATTASNSEINSKVLAVLGAGLQWDFGELWTIERSTQRLRCEATWHPPVTEFHDFVAQSQHLSFASGQGLPGRVWASGRPEWCADLLQGMAYPTDRQMIPLGLRGWIGFPIKLRREVVGVIGFFSRKAIPPDAELLALFDSIGLQMGQFIEQQHITDQLRQAQKMEAIGMLAGGIAHDFNNILGGIFGYCELARMEAGDNVSLAGHLDGLMSGARRATDLVQQILQFNRHHDQERHPIQLRHVTMEALRLLRAAVPAIVEFETWLGSDAPVVLANATQIHQVLMNLGTNAAHAMRKNGGRLTVKLEDFQVGPELATAHSELRVGRYARLTVSDTGHGMDAATLERIYDPLFTTKPPGEGTGLGLAVVRGIVRTHEGSIVVVSHPGQGSTFQVYFPAHLADAEDASSIVPVVPRGGGERILLVDDDPLLGDVGKLVLDHMGYITDTCSNGRQAIDLVSADPAAYALVITDQMMPGMTGTDLAQRLNTIRADLPVILTTGCTRSLLPDRLSELGIRQLLPKPLSLQALAAAVHHVLQPTNGTALKSPSAPPELK